MNRGIERELGQYGFIRAVDAESYVLQTGKNTFLIVENEEFEGRFYYNFYKQSGFRQVHLKFYGKMLREKQLIVRVEKYFKNRRKFLLNQLAKRNGALKSTKEVLQEIKVRQESLVEMKVIQMDLNI